MEIYIPQPTAELLLQITAEQEITAEELLNSVVKKYIERTKKIGG